MVCPILIVPALDLCIVGYEPLHLSATNEMNDSLSIALTGAIAVGSAIFLLSFWHSYLGFKIMHKLGSKYEPSGRIGDIPYWRLFEHYIRMPKLYIEKYGYDRLVRNYRALLIVLLVLCPIWLILVFLASLR